MPRIRTIKPEFWRSLTLARLSREERLFFIGLWNFSDDEGRGVAEPRLLKGDLFPMDDDIGAAHIASWLEHLAAERLIIIYGTATGKPLFAIRSWSEHQRVEKPKASQYPPPPDGSPIPPRLLPDAYPLEGKGREMEGKGNGMGKEQGDGGGVGGIPTDLTGWLPVEYHPDLEGAYRSSRSPVALLAEIRVLRDHPDLRNLAGVTGAHVGEAIRDAALKGAQLSGRTLRGFVQKAQQAPQRPGGATNGAGLGSRSARTFAALQSFANGDTDGSR